MTLDAESETYSGDKWGFVGWDKNFTLYYSMEEVKVKYILT